MYLWHSGVKISQWSYKVLIKTNEITYDVFKKKINKRPSTDHNTLDGMVNGLGFPNY